MSARASSRSFCDPTGSSVVRIVGPAPQTECVEQRRGLGAEHRLLAGRASEPESLPPGGGADPAMGTDQDVLDDRRAGQHPSGLERSDHPPRGDPRRIQAHERPTEQLRLSGIGRHEVREQVEERGLPRPNSDQ